MKIKGLPGYFRQRNNRWSWQVILPGTISRQLISLKPAGAEYATTDKQVAVEIAKEIYRNAILESQGEKTDHTIASICQQYIIKEAVFYSHAEQKNLQRIAKRLALLFGTMQSEDFTAASLKEFRQELLEGKRQLARKTVNKYTNYAKRILRWAVSEGLTPASVHHGISTVTGLRKGRTTAPETPDIEPVDDIDVDRTIKHAVALIGDMVRLQRLTAMRSGELVIMRPCDIDRAGDVWIYTPDSHKTEHLGHEHPISIGPKAQKILLPYLLRRADAFCFEPKEALRQRRRGARAYGKHYTTKSYYKTIQYAIKLGHKAHGIEYIKSWTPHQLRHTAATRIREELGIEAACAILGHSDITATQIYARMRSDTATKAARQLG